MSDQKDIFDKFSETTRKVLVTSQRIAQSMGSGIDTEHILLALAATPGTLAHDVLKEYMVSVDQIRLVLSLRQLHSHVSSGISASAKKILKDAIKLAAKYRHVSVDSEHLLMALIADKNSLPYQIIAQIGVDPEQIKQQLEYIFKDLSEMDVLLHQQQGNIQEKRIEEEKEFTPIRTKKRQNTPALDYFSVDLTAKAASPESDPIIGREKEIERAIQVLSRRTKNNPVFIGEPGVGKTAIVEGLAQRIVKGSAPPKLQNRRILSLDLALLVAGTMYRGQFEDRIKKVLDEIKKSNDVILFIDEFHMVVGAGSAEGSMDAANILKPALAKGTIRLIGATTMDEYRKHIEKDAALERRLQPIIARESSVEETVDILKGIRSQYEKFHGVKITDDALRTAAELSERYMTERFLPDKAIDLMDEAAAVSEIKVGFSGKADKINQLKKDIRTVQELKEREIDEENFERAARFRDEELKLKKKLSKLLINQKEEDKPKVTPSDIAKIVAATTGVPVTDLLKKDKIRFLHLEESLSKKIIAQEEAIREVASAIRRNKTGVSDPKRPIGSFMFLGPTGVGKTELAKVLASEVYGRKDALIKVDMSEFMEKHNVSRLIGAPPGYVGYEEAGKLTESVRRNPYSLVLFDEIEKAHPDVFNILLQVLEDGYLTDGQGRLVNFKNTIVIMTSNIGIKEFNQQAEIGFGATTTGDKHSFIKGFEKLKDYLLKQLKDKFRPEFLNRLDKIVIFNPLERKALRKIVKLQLNELGSKLKKSEGIELSYTNSLVNWLVNESFDPEFGARPIRREIADQIANRLADSLLKDEIKKGQKILADLDKKRNLIIFKTQKK